MRHPDDERVHLLRLGCGDLAKEFLLSQRRRVVYHTRREVTRAPEEVDATVDELRGSRHLGGFEGDGIRLVVQRQARRECHSPDLQRGAHHTKYLPDGLDADWHGDWDDGRCIPRAGAGHLEGNSRLVRLGQALHQRLHRIGLLPLRLLLGLGFGLERRCARGRSLGDTLAPRGYLLLGQRDEHLPVREHAPVDRVHVPLKGELRLRLHVDECDDGYTDAELAPHRTEQLAHLLGRLGRGCTDHAAVRHRNRLDVGDAAALAPDHESLGARRVVAGEDAADRLGVLRSGRLRVTGRSSRGGCSRGRDGLRWGLSGRTEGTRGARARRRLGGFCRDATAWGRAPHDEGLGHLGDHRGRHG